MRNSKLSRVFSLLAICTVMTLLCFSAFAADNVVYVEDGGSGDGSSASSALGSLTDAYNALGDEGGTIVVSGLYTVSEQFIAPTHTGKVLITSYDGSVDYESTNGAAINFYASMYLSGETAFNHLTLRCCSTTANSYPYYGIFGRANDVTLGTGIVSEKDENSNTYLSFIGGSSAVYKNKTANVIIKSGIWQRVRGGANKGGAVNYNINLIVNGGTFMEKLILASCATSGSNSHTGDITAIVNGGTFYGGICLTSFLSDDDAYSGSASLTVNGGTVYGILGVAFDEVGNYDGDFTLKINGGDFKHLTDICGGANLDGDFTSTLSYAEDVDLTTAESGTLTFTNYMRRNGADPFMFYHDGYYYYTATGSTTVSLIKAANISDVQNAQAHTILSPSDYTDLWSPEIHYFSADEIGEEYAGWYMFIGAKEADSTGTTASNQRQYVVKCLDGDNLFGDWGDPVTGEVNVLRKMTFENGGYNEDALCGGTSVIRINGNVYLTFVSEEGRGTSSFHQTINITTFENPWTITGTPTEICRPDYDWEKHGYWYDESADTWYPQVVEGASPVYGRDGEVYLMYTGSGYWTTWYALGYLKFLGGDPLDADSWQKNPTPVLQREEPLTDTSVNGSGHGSYFTDKDGQMWVAYHGYIGTDTSSKRFSFVEPIYVTANGVTVGTGTTHPASLSTKYTINVNPISLEEKIHGFNTLTVNTSTDLEGGVTVRFNPIEDATAYVVRRDGKLVYSGSAFTCTDTEATPGTHTYTVQAVKSGSILDAVSATEVARNNLRFKDVNSDGKFSITDLLAVLKDFLNANEQSVEFLDIIQMLKCI